MWRLLTKPLEEGQLVMVRNQIKVTRNLWRKLSFFIMITCLLTIVTLAFGQIVRGEGTGVDDTNYFHVDIEDQWVEIPEQTLSAYSEQVCQKTDQTIQYLAGYASTSGNNWFELPFILVTSNENGKWPQKKLDKIVSESTKEIQESLDQLNDVLPTHVGEISYEKRRRIIWMDTVSDVPQLGKVHAITAIMLTEIGDLNFILYVASSDRETRLREFSDLLNRVTLDPAFVYRSEPERALKVLERSLPDVFYRLRFRSLFYGFILLCIVLFAGTYKVMSRIISKRKEIPKK
jgi:hypothetical protein